MKKSCTSDKILNPSTGRCVLKSGKIGQKLLGKKKSAPKAPKAPKALKGKKCSNNKILNPSTGRCVLKSGKIGQKLMKKAIVDSPDETLGQMFPELFKKQPKKQAKLLQLTPKKGGAKSPFVIRKRMASPPLDILKTPMVKRTDFKGTYLQGLIGLVYLMNKYPDACTTVNNVTGKTSDFAFTWTCVNRKRTIIPPRDFIKNWKKCLKNKKIKTIVVPMRLENLNGCRKKNVGHANYFIYSKKRKTIERFEPNGGAVSIDKRFFQSDKIDAAFRDWFFKRPELEITTYLTPMQLCPKGGFQDAQAKEALKVLGDPGGFCLAWNLWYVNLRLNNPDKDPDKLIIKAIKALNTPSKTRTAFIRNYSQFILNESQKVFKKINVKTIKGRKMYPHMFKRFNEEIGKLLANY